MWHHKKSHKQNFKFAKANTKNPVSANVHLFMSFVNNYLESFIALELLLHHQIDKISVDVGVINCRTGVANNTRLRIITSFRRKLLILIFVSLKLGSS
jgi:hypothetical protein